ncbi:dihydrofolate reductase [Sodiomyces alkalinus F11]|uniref:Dihydrofolate reductase n=1 Tax=Sodiomyces alkalinus (strain CBS 110278 / VKM F-3762 / F11) TaxID=1314773 RepID=A0A3N2Q0T0_SODAK|nr:dihydrofolate reductase [Sodiomyces alkalinus F11]ROT40373.1 dihydrofolate reductase [Sodiomyces alkalinus F11]
MTPSAAPAAALELTLIVAATRSMGIGFNGGLPWTGLKKEMAYFARVTKRLSPQAPSGAMNAVIMGRKTWDSIPERFRPLKDRLNVVISRSHPDLGTASSGATATATAAATEPVRVASLDAAIAYLSSAERPPVGKVFVIGGAQIYAAALRTAYAKRVLLTSVLEPEFGCDVFFPLGLGGGLESEVKGWAKREKAALDAWVGEEVQEGVQEENGTRYEFQMWEATESNYN